MLCDSCFQFLSEAVLGRRESRPQNLPSVLNAAADGCYICGFAIERLLESQKRDNCQVEQFQFHREQVWSGITHLFLSITLCYDQEYSTKDVIFLFTQTRGFPVTEAELIRRREGYIAEVEAVIKIREWMGLCLRDHDGTRCRKNGTEPGSYPSRLLELGLSSFRVVKTSVERPRGPYAALSYCWGPNPAFLRLTSGNETELEAGVSTSRLPLAFKEAISIIQALSFRYLWIDSLCIIQSGLGSAEDWETESARMHQIYADSTLTLALACAASPTESILNQACNQKTAAPPLAITVDSGRQDRDADALTIIPGDYFARGLNEQPLNHRAWALQERVMATRVVSFGLGELFWDCAQLPNASESIPRGLQATQMETALDSFKPATKTIPDGSSEFELMRTWWSLLQEYTKRRLTYPKTDRLMALSAIAYEMGKAMDDVYIAGHFWKTLPASLNWVLGERTPWSLDRYEEKARRVFWSEKPGAQDNGPRTPSWSWASLDGPTATLWAKGLNYGELELAEAVSYTLELANQANPTGPCMSASISIRAYCTELEWQSRNKPVMVARTEAWTCEKFPLRVELDEPEVRRGKGTKSLMVALMEVPSWSGLVVQDISHEGGNRYRRIGHFLISTPGIYRYEGSPWRDECISMFGEEKRLVELV